MNTVHITTMALWDICKGSGRVSTILPLLGYIERGHNVYYLTTLSMYKNISEEDGIRIFYIHIPFFHKLDRPIFSLLFLPIINLYFILKAFQILKKIDVDVVYAHSASLALSGNILSKIFHAKYVLRLYGIGTAYSKRFKPSSIIRRIAFLFKADSYILTDDGTHADLFAKSCKIPNEKIHFLRNGIDKNRVNDEIDNELKLKYAPNGEKLLLSVCRLSNTKCVDTVILVFSKLITICPNIKLLIVGDGSERESLIDLVNRLNINQNVCFIESLPQPEVFRYMKISDLFVAMNKESNLSNPVFEAMLNGLPIVALNSGNTSSLITNNINGILVEQNDLNSLHTRLFEILQNEPFVKELGENAQRYILSNFMSWDERVRYEVDLIEELVEN